MPELGIVLASTRPNRVGAPVGRWFAERAKQHGKFEIQVVDLKEIALPPMDEPNHPLKRLYLNEHTKAWSRTVGALDALVFVIPEYNYGMPPALLNAFDYVSLEWHYKAAGFVSYGGVSGGTRSAQMCRLTASSLKMMPIPEQVHLPFVAKLVDSSGNLDPGAAQDESAIRMLDELLRWTEALAGMREDLRKTLKPV